MSPCTALRDGNHHLSAVLGWFMKGGASESVERYVLQRHLPFLQSIDRASLNQFLVNPVLPFPVSSAFALPSGYLKSISCSVYHCILAERAHQSNKALPTLNRVSWNFHEFPISGVKRWFFVYLFVSFFWKRSCCVMLMFTGNVGKPSPAGITNEWAKV